MDNSRRLKLESMRAKLNEMIASGNAEANEILKLSQELDILIVEEMKNMLKDRKKSKNEQNNLFEINRVLEITNFTEKMYDILRLVDPVNKRVIEYKENKEIKEAFYCYEFWEKNKICSNCISIQAVNEDKIFIKLDNSAQDYYITIAIPIMLQGKRIAAEFLKNISKNLVANDEYDKYIETVFEKLKDMKEFKFLFCK